MNRTDLRIAFKMDTGEGALWAEDHDGTDIGGYGNRPTTFIKGRPRSIYGEWLEEQIGKPKYLRDRFYKLHKEIPMSNYFGGCTRRYPVYHEDYIEWMEDFLLHFKPKGYGEPRGYYYIMNHILGFSIEDNERMS
jgi:hypothetical protein